MDTGTRDVDRELGMDFHTLDEVQGRQAFAPTPSPAMRRRLVGGHVETETGPVALGPMHAIYPWVIGSPLSQHNPVQMDDVAVLVHEVREGARLVWKAYKQSDLVVEEIGLARKMLGSDETRGLVLWGSARWLWRFRGLGETFEGRTEAQPVHVRVGEKQGLEAVTDLHVVLFLDGQCMPAAWLGHAALEEEPQSSVMFPGAATIGL